MGVLGIVLSIILGGGFLLFGLMKFGSKQIQDNFSRWGLPQWFRIPIGLIEIAGALLMIAGIWIAETIYLGSILLSATMFGAILIHLRAKDPFSAMMPPVVLFILALAALGVNGG